MLLIRSAAVPFALLLVTCGTDPAPPDASVPEDAGVDAGFDAGRRDGGFDAGAPSGWARLSGLPEDCVVESAEDPASELSLTWRECEPGVEGCWVTGPLPFDGAVRERGWSDGRQGYFGVSFGDSSRRIVAALVATLDGARGYWRSYRPPADRRACIVGSVGVGEGHAAFSVEYIDGRARERDQDIIFHGPIDRLPELRAPTAAVTGDIARGGDPQRMAVTSELVAYAWQPAGFLYVIGADGSQYGFINDAVMGSTQNPSAVGADVFWEDWQDSVRIAHARQGVEPAFFLDISPDDVLSYFTDGVEHVWLEARGRRTDVSWDSVVLMAAPYTADRATLASRAVTEVDTLRPATYGGGWYALIRADPRQLEVIRTADGTRRAWTPPTGYELVHRYPIYASDHEVMVHALMDGDDYLFRVDPHALPTLE